MGLCGYTGGYMSEWGIDNLIGGIQNIYPDTCKVIPLEDSREGRPIRAIKIGKGSGATRRGVLYVGGIHARELLNPDALIYFSFNLAIAYKQNKDLILGGHKYSAAFVRVIIDNMDIFILPLANPDGRAYVLSPNGDRMWRGNRAPNSGQACKGVDINRNFDFLWSSGISTSTDPCSQLYRGPSAFSEPETRNVRLLLDSFPHIAGMIDVHSYGESILHPWGDDENQTVKPTMNFTNPAFSGQQGTKGDAYKEYIRKADLDWGVSVGNTMEKAIAAVREKNYSVKQSVYLYPTSATSDDYCYSRHFVNGAKRKVLSYCIETGPLVIKNGSPDYLASFQPPFPEASCIMEDVQPAFMEFCINILCASNELIDSIMMAASKVHISKSAGRSARLSRAGSKFVKLLEQNRDELLELARKDTRLWRQSLVALKRVLPIIQSDQSARPRVFDEALVQRVDALLNRLGELGSPKLRRATRSLRQDLQPFVGRTMIEGLRAVDESQDRRVSV